MIQIGICSHKNDMLKASGCDYVESHFASIATMSEEKFEEFLAAKKEKGLSVYSTNGMLADGIVLSERDGQENFGLTEYLHTGYSRLQRLGGKYCVIGSGKARNYPEGDTCEQGMERFARFVKCACVVAKEYGIFNVIEPLNSRETNIVFTVLDGYRIYELAGKPENLGVLADLYHVSLGDSISNLEKLKDRLWHCHIAHPVTRLTPMPNDGGEETYRDLFATLKKIGYQGRISIEAAPVNGDEDYSISVAYLKELQA